MHPLRYAGEIVGSAEAADRRERYGNRNGNYIMALIETATTALGARTRLRTLIDPTRRGNVGRYINHSCAPNLATVRTHAPSRACHACRFSNPKHAARTAAASRLRL